MGIFGKKKNDDNNGSKMEKLFKDSGLETTKDEKKALSRKEMEQQALKLQKLESIHSQIKDKFNAVRKTMLVSENDKISEGDVEKINKLIRTYNMVCDLEQDNLNVDATCAVDNLILNALNRIVEGCLRNNEQTVSDTLTLLAGYVADRYSCNPYYSNEKYVKAVNERHRYYLEKQRCVADKANLQERLNELKEERNNPNAVLSDIAREVQSIQSKAKELNVKIDSFENKVKLCEKIMSEIQNSDVIHVSDATFNLLDEIDSALELKSENESMEDTIEKRSGKFNETKRKVSANSLNVDDSAIEQKAPKITLTDDDFKI